PDQAPGHLGSTQITASSGAGRGRARKGSGVTERPGTDDDEAPALPEVTVPPWLRTGPAADPSVSTPQPADGPAPGADDAVAGRADAPEPDDTAEIPPARITLGAGSREDATGGPAARSEAAPARLPAEERIPGHEDRWEERRVGEGCSARGAGCAGGG